MPESSADLTSKALTSKISSDLFSTDSAIAVMSSDFSWPERVLAILFVLNLARSIALQSEVFLK